MATVARSRKRPTFSNARLMMSEVRVEEGQEVRKEVQNVEEGQEDEGFEEGQE